MTRVTGHVRRVARKRGDVFYLKYRLADGRQIQRVLGPRWSERSRPPAGYYTDRTAEEALQTILADARRGTLADHDRPSGRSFGDACAEWLRYCEAEGCAESTVRDYRNMVNGRLLKHFGRDTPLEKITTEKIDAYRDDLVADDDLTLRTAQKLMVALHGILKRAVRKKWIGTNAAASAEKVKVTRSGSFNVLEPVQIASVASAAKTAQDAAAFTVAAFTGLRLGELRALRWRDVRFGDSVIQVNRNLPAGGTEKTPKSGKVRAVPLIDQAARPLDALSRREHHTTPDDYVFVAEDGGPIDGDGIRDAFYDALADAGLGHLRERVTDPVIFHDLRHTFGSLGARTWPLHDLKAYMGHAKIETTERYMHHVPKVSAAAEMTRAIEAAMSGGHALSMEGHGETMATSITDTGESRA